MSITLTPVSTQQKLSRSRARFLAFVSRGCEDGESKVFCLFEGEGEIELDNVDLCSVGVFGVEGCDCTPREDPPDTEHSY